MLTQVEASTDTLYPSNQPLLQLVGYHNSLPERQLLVSSVNDMLALGTGKEVDQIHNTIFMNIPSLKDIGGRKVLLFCGTRNMLRGSNAEVSALVLVKHSAKDGGRIKVRPG